MEKLGINTMGLLAQIVNVGLLLFVFMKFLYKPILKVLEKRQQSIENNIRLEEQLEAKLAAFKETEKELLRQTKLDAHRIVEESQHQAKATEAVLLSKAKEEALAFKKEARENLQKELEAEREKLEEMVARKAVEVANAAIGKLLNQKTHDLLTEKQVREFVKKTQLS